MGVCGRALLLDTAAENGRIRRCLSADHDSLRVDRRRIRQNIRDYGHCGSGSVGSFFPDFQADQPWGDLETEICVHERDGAVTEVEKRYQSMSVTYEGPARNLVAVPEDFLKISGLQCREIL